jgi:transcriptional regulator with XRE-family HTH domain
VNRIEEWLYPLTQQSLADASGMSRQGVQNLIRGRQRFARLSKVNHILKHLERGYLYQEEILQNPLRGPLRIEEVWPELKTDE